MHQGREQNIIHAIFRGGAIRFDRTGTPGRSGRDGSVVPGDGPGESLFALEEHEHGTQEVFRVLVYASGQNDVAAAERIDRAFRRRPCRPAWTIRPIRSNSRAGCRKTGGPTRLQPRVTAHNAGRRRCRATASTAKNTRLRNKSPSAIDTPLFWTWRRLPRPRLGGR